VERLQALPAPHRPAVRHTGVGYPVDDNREFVAVVALAVHWYHVNLRAPERTGGLHDLWK
jgi:hypothetical protein